MKYPSPVNPLILLYRGHIPALKNNKQLTENGQLIPNNAVIDFIKRVKSSVSKQVESQGFDRMSFPTPVAAYVEIYFFTKQDHGMAKADGDNAYTMLQETWQSEEVGALGAALGVLEDDRQVIGFHCEIFPVPDKSLEGAKVFLWQMSLPKSLRRDERAAFDTWLYQYELATANPSDEETLDFAKVDQDLW